MAKKSKTSREASTEDATTAEKIFHAAEELFCTVGYEAVSVRDVAEKAGVNKASVFYHYESKEALFDAVVERYYEAHRRALEGALAREGTVRERMHRLVDAYLRFMAANARYAQLVQAQLSHLDTHPLVEKNFAPLYRFIEEALREVAPAVGPTSARQLFVTFSGAVLGWCTYAPLLERTWRSNPLGHKLLEERSTHLRWLVDLLLDDLLREQKEAPAQTAPP